MKRGFALAAALIATAYWPFAAIYILGTPVWFGEPHVYTLTVGVALIWAAYGSKKPEVMCVAAIVLSVAAGLWVMTLPITALYVIFAWLGYYYMDKTAPADDYDDETW